MMVIEKCVQEPTKKTKFNVINHNYCLALDVYIIIPRYISKLFFCFRFMRGELNSRCADGLMNRVGLSKGDITPGTPSNPSLVRQPPSYQRMHSNDSGSGKGSDKDTNGTSGLTRD